MLNVTDVKQRASIASMIYALQEKDAEYAELENAIFTKIGKTIGKIFYCLKYQKFNSIKGFIFDRYSRAKIRRKVKDRLPSRENEQYSESDFFSSERIAVYTAIFGNYDSIHEPMIAPDNIDYYLITDGPPPKVLSKWKMITVDLPDGLSSAEKNRYVKMHSHILFPEYKYSIYVDGSVRIMSDLTPLIHRIGEYGVAMHKHSTRDDVYDELYAAKCTNRISKEDYKRYEEFLREKKMPSNYGLVECGVIARKHSEPICIKIMDQWWQQYLKGIKRDQICLAYVLFDNDIKMDYIGTLGTNIYNNWLFKIFLHK